MDKREGDCPRQVACDEGRNQEVDGIEPDTGNANSLLSVCFVGSDLEFGGGVAFVRFSWF